MDALAKITGCPVGKYLILTACMSCSNICPGDDDDWSICPSACPEWSLRPIILDTLQGLVFDTDNANETFAIWANGTSEEDTNEKNSLLRDTNCTGTSPDGNSTDTSKHVPLTKIILTWPWVVRVALLGAGGLVVIAVIIIITLKKASHIYARCLAILCYLRVRTSPHSDSHLLPEVIIEDDPMGQPHPCLTRQNSLKRRGPRTLEDTVAVKYQQSPTRESPGNTRANAAGTVDDRQQAAVPGASRVISVQPGIHPEQESEASPGRSRHRQPIAAGHSGYTRMNSMSDEIPGITRDEEPVCTNLELGDSNLSHSYPFPATPDQVNTCLIRPEYQKLRDSNSFQPRESYTAFKFQTEKGSFPDLPMTIT